MRLKGDTVKLECIRVPEVNWLENHVRVPTYANIVSGGKQSGSGCHSLTYDVLTFEDFSGLEVVSSPELWNEATLGRTLKGNADSRRLVCCWASHEAEPELKTRGALMNGRSTTQHLRYSLSTLPGTERDRFGNAVGRRFDLACR